jgi:hypothetical protein
MKQCEDCLSQKKADNCIRCARAFRRRAEITEIELWEIHRIVETTPFKRLKDKLLERMS